MSLSARQIDIGWQNHRIGSRLVHETEEMRVWHVYLAPGAVIPPHRHDRPYIWTVLSDGQGVSRFSDGRELTITYRAGDTGDYSHLTPETGFVHDLTNVGDTELIFVTVEFNPVFSEHPYDGCEPNVLSVVKNHRVG